MPLANDTDYRTDRLGDRRHRGRSAADRGAGQRGQRVRAGHLPHLREELRTIGTHSFGYSGLGGSRTGPDSILRFVRRKAMHDAPRRTRRHLRRQAPASAGAGGTEMTQWQLSGARSRSRSRNCMLAYAWGIDLADIDMALSTFAEDAWFDHLWQGKVQGHAAIRKNLEVAVVRPADWWYRPPAPDEPLHHGSAEQEGDGATCAASSRSCSSTSITAPIS